MSRPPNPEPSRAELEAAGHVFLEWVSPLAHEEPGYAHYYGTVTFLGGEWILSARHVLEDAFQREDLGHPFVGLPRAEEGQRDRASVVAWEAHPDEHVDLAVGRLSEPWARYPFQGIGYTPANIDLECVGYPEDLFLTLLGKPNPTVRYLRGHLTRRMDEWVGGRGPALELSYPIPEGMSGSPIYGRTGQDYWLFGIAVGNQESHLAVRESLHLEPDEGKSIYRITEYGVALRLSAQVKWEIQLADGATLSHLVQPRPH
jgi:Trypsin-like peptidase domain